MRTQVLSLILVSILSQLEGDISESNLFLSLKKKSKRQKCACVSKRQWLWLPNTLNMTHTLTGQQLGMKSSLCRGKLSFSCETQGI